MGWLENSLKSAIIIFLSIMLVVAIVAGIKAISSWSVVFFSVSFVSFVTFLAACYLSIFYRVPAVQIGVPESLVLGRFKPDSEDECFCSVPIYDTQTEGLHMKWPHHKIHLLGREIRTLKIDNQRYDIKKGAVIVSGIMQYRRSELCAYRALAAPEQDTIDGMNAIADQILVSKLINSDLEEALQLKADLKDAIRAAFNSPAQVKDPNNPTADPIDRTLKGTKVSVTQHRFGIEVLSVKIDKLDPIKELADARAAVQVEALKRGQAKEKMKRFNHIKDKLDTMFPLLSDEMIGEKLELIEGLSTKEKKLYGLSDLDDVSKAIANIASMFRGGSPL